MIKTRGAKLTDWAEIVAGALALAAVWIVGLRTGWFVVHVVFPLAFWLVADGIAGLQGQEQLLRRPALFARMTILGAAMGLVLDFYMVSLTRVLDLTAVADAGIALQMYLGWGFCLPAVCQSYRVALRFLGKVARLPLNIALTGPSPLGFAFLPVVAFPLAAMPLFFRLWVGAVPGYLIVSSFLGFWLLAEVIQHRRARSGLLTAIWRGDLRPVLAMALASLPFTLLWEGLNALMGSWSYQNLFWLQPEILGVPLVAYFGYFSGYYVIFLSFFAALTEEDALPVF